MQKYEKPISKIIEYKPIDVITASADTVPDTPENPGENGGNLNEPADNTFFF